MLLRERGGRRIGSPNDFSMRTNQTAYCLRQGASKRDLEEEPIAVPMTGVTACSYLRKGAQRRGNAGVPKPPFLG